MVLDFTMTIPVSSDKRQKYLGYFGGVVDLPVRATLFGIPVNLFVLKGEEGGAVTIAGHFIRDLKKPIDGVLDISDAN